MGCCGLLWAVVGCYGLLWAAVGCCGLLWAAVAVFVGTRAPCSRCTDLGGAPLRLLAAGAGSTAHDDGDDGADEPTTAADIRKAFSVRASPSIRRSVSGSGRREVPAPPPPIVAPTLPINRAMSVSGRTPRAEAKIRVITVGTPTHLQGVACSFIELMRGRLEEVSASSVDHRRCNFV